MYDKSIAVLGLHDKENPGDQLQWITIKNRFPDPRIDWSQDPFWEKYDLIMLELEALAKLGKDFPNVGLACLGESSKTYD